MRSLNIRRLNSFKIKKINEGTNILYDLIAEFYESLVDDNMSEIDNVAKEIIAQVKKISKEKYLTDEELETKPDFWR